jgi:hypothetical protein
VTIPAFIGYSHVIVALVTELGLILVATHAGTIQTHEISLPVARYVDRPGIPNDRISPVLQQILVIGANEILGLHTLFLIRWEFRFWYVAHLSTRCIMPEWKGD